MSEEQKEVCISMQDTMLSQESVARLREAFQALLNVQYDRKLYDECSALGKVSVANPEVMFVKHAKDGEFDGLTDEQYELLLHEVGRKGNLWNHEKDVSLSYPQALASLLTLLPDVLMALHQLLLVSDLHDAVEKYEESDSLFQKPCEELFPEDVAQLIKRCL